LSNSAVYPLDVVHHQASGQLALHWNDELQARLDSYTLRSACRCAACEKMRRAGSGPTASSAVQLTELIALGSLGLQLRFDDGHDRGIYPWSYLYELSLATRVATTT
jgi:DUF971 family protein